MLANSPLIAVHGMSELCHDTARTLRPYEAPGTLASFACGTGSVERGIKMSQLEPQNVPDRQRRKVLGSTFCRHVCWLTKSR